VHLTGLRVDPVHLKDALRDIYCVRRMRHGGPPVRAAAGGTASPYRAVIANEPGGVHTIFTTGAKCDGLQLQQGCAEAGAELPFVFLTGQGDVPSAVSAMRQGAVDFLDKWAPKHALLASLERALERDANERGSRARRQQLERRFAALTDRELEVLGHVVHGRMNKQIAAALGSHEGTVKLHRRAITTKLGVHGVAELTTLTRATRYHRRAVVKDVAVTITCSTENRVVENRP